MFLLCARLFAAAAAAIFLATMPVTTHASLSYPVYSHTFTSPLSVASDHLAFAPSFDDFDLGGDFGVEAALNAFDGDDVSGGGASAQFDHENFGEETKNEETKSGETKSDEKVYNDDWIVGFSDDEEFLTEPDDDDEDDDEEEQKAESCAAGSDHDEGNEGQVAAEDDDDASTVLYDASEDGDDGKEEDDDEDDDDEEDDDDDDDDKVLTVLCDVDAESVELYEAAVFAGEEVAMEEVVLVGAEGDDDDEMSVEEVQMSEPEAMLEDDDEDGIPTMTERMSLLHILDDDIEVPDAPPLPSVFFEDIEMSLAPPLSEYWLMTIA